MIEIRSSALPGCVSDIDRSERMSVALACSQQKLFFVSRTLKSFGKLFPNFPNAGETYSKAFRAFFPFLTGAIVHELVRQLACGKAQVTEEGNTWYNSGEMQKALEILDESLQELAERSQKYTTSPTPLECQKRKNLFLLLADAIACELVRQLTRGIAWITRKSVRYEWDGMSAALAEGLKDADGDVRNMFDQKITDRRWVDEQIMFTAQHMNEWGITVERQCCPNWTLSLVSPDKDVATEVEALDVFNRVPESSEGEPVQAPSANFEVQMIQSPPVRQPRSSKKLVAGSRAKMVSRATASSERESVQRSPIESRARGIRKRMRQSPRLTRKEMRSLRRTILERCAKTDRTPTDIQSIFQLCSDIGAVERKGMMPRGVGSFIREVRKKENQTMGLDHNNDAFVPEPLRKAVTSSVRGHIQCLKNLKLWGRKRWVKYGANGNFRNPTEPYIYVFNRISVFVEAYKAESCWCQQNTQEGEDVIRRVSDQFIDDLITQSDTCSRGVTE